VRVSRTKADAKTRAMKIFFLLLFTICINTIFGQQAKRFICPMKKGRIVIEHFRNADEVKRNPGATIEGKGKNAYSCSPGLVTSIDTAHGLLCVFIEFENYSFGYYHFKSVKVTKGQSIKEGAIIGIVDDDERLFLIFSRNNELIEPESVLKCKVVHRYL
jgi:hypothetical protein